MRSAQLEIFEFICCAILVLFLCHFILEVLP